ncbi:SusF/SusE family outer membrane protein [Bacteroidota bacterium]
MKNKLFKGAAMLMMLAVVSLVAITSCDTDPEPIPIPVEDGLYIRGAGTALDSLSGDGLMSLTKNEVKQEIRNSLYEVYIAVEGGSDGFNLVNVVGGAEEVWGPGTDFAEVDTATLDIEEPQAGLWRGSYTMTETPFTVAEDGLYHVVVDTDLGVVAVAKVEWGLIGGATPGGWSDDTEMVESTFDMNTMTFTIEEVTLLEGKFKFRYSGGWKVILDTEFDNGEGVLGVKANTNFGGTVAALDAGGSDIANDTYGIYKFVITWKLGEGISAEQTWVRDGDPLPEYPGELYMIGGALNLDDSDSNGTPDGWQWELTDMPLIPVHSNPHLFWRIVYLETSEGIKFAPGKEWVGDFGATGDATDGVYAKGGDNVPAPAEAGYYIVVVNLLDETVEVNPAKVYGIGNVFSDNSWTGSSETNMFTVDNTAKTITSPAFATDGELRIHTSASTMTNGEGNAVDWWQAEFMLLDGMIEYRGTGDDQARVNVTAGQTITLNFADGTGTIQ